MERLHSFGWNPDLMPPFVKQLLLLLLFFLHPYAFRANRSSDAPAGRHNRRIPPAWLSLTLFSRFSPRGDAAKVTRTCRNPSGGFDFGRRAFRRSCERQSDLHPIRGCRHEEVEVPAIHPRRATDSNRLQHAVRLCHRLTSSRSLRS